MRDEKPELTISEDVAERGLHPIELADMAKWTLDAAGLPSQEAYESISGAPNEVEALAIARRFVIIRQETAGGITDEYKSIEQSWDYVCEAVWYAATATQCWPEQPVGATQARVEAVKCLHQSGYLGSADVSAHERLKGVHDEMLRAQQFGGSSTEAEHFILEARRLEETLWARVPSDKLPDGMLCEVESPTSGMRRQVRRLRREGELAL